MNFGEVPLRHELKYYIGRDDYIGLRERLKTVMNPDRFSVSEEGYHIRSLYFDNWRESALYDKLGGVFERKKYRVRIYNKEDKIIRLERKSRFGEYIGKAGAPLTREQYERLIAGDVGFMRQSEHRLFREFYLDYRRGGLVPTVIVDYVREAYEFSVEDVRVTFDKSLASSINSLDLFDRELVTAPVLGEARMIMEVKFNAFLPGIIRRLLQIESHNRAAISKYVLCRQVRKCFAE